MKSRVRGLKAMLLAAAFALPQGAAMCAVSCTFSSAAPVSFGAYDVFSMLPNNNGVGSLSVDCSGAGNHVFEVSLSRGQSHSYSPRVLRSGNAGLNYNLYTGAERSVVWGDGSGVTEKLTFNKNKPVLLPIYGQIPAGQDVPVGAYSDQITATVNF